MARYRTYRNGITGCRYRGYYIIRGEKGKFQIWNEDATVHLDNLFDYDECEWIIDKEKAEKEEIAMAKSLYAMEFFELNSLFVELMQKRKTVGLDEAGEVRYRWISKIRRRRVKDREF